MSRAGAPRSSRAREPDELRPPGPSACPGLASAGFTLVEILVVLLLAFTLLLVALPQFFVPGEVDAGLLARQVAADLGLARRLAIAQQMNFTMGFLPPAGPYTLYTLRNAGGDVQPGFPKELSSTVTVSGTTPITFTPDGSATAAATLTFVVGTEVAQIDVIAATGRVQLTRP